MSPCPSCFDFHLDGMTLPEREQQRHSMALRGVRPEMSFKRPLIFRDKVEDFHEAAMECRYASRLKSAPPISAGEHSDARAKGNSEGKNSPKADGVPAGIAPRRRRFWGVDPARTFIFGGGPPKGLPGLLLRVSARTTARGLTLRTEGRRYS